VGCVTSARSPREGVPCIVRVPTIAHHEGRTSRLNRSGRNERHFTQDGVEMGGKARTPRKVCKCVQNLAKASKRPQAQRKGRRTSQARDQQKPTRQGRVMVGLSNGPALPYPTTITGPWGGAFFRFIKQKNKQLSGPLTPQTWNGKRNCQQKSRPTSRTGVTLSERFRSLLASSFFATTPQRAFSPRQKKGFSHMEPLLGFTSKKSFTHTQHREFRPTAASRFTANPR